MDESIYNARIQFMPFWLILDVGEVLQSLEYATDTLAVRFSEDLVNTLVDESNIYTALLDWTQGQVCSAHLFLNSPEGELFLEINKLSQEFVNKFKEYQLFQDGIMPYKFEKILDDGSLLLRLINNFEEYIQLSTPRAENKEDFQ